eukprot:m51a1_g2415 hypothetical protein (332) ;mRNA; r:798463-799587
MATAPEATHPVAPQQAVEAAKKFEARKNGRYHSLATYTPELCSEIQPWVLAHMDLVHKLRSRSKTGAAAKVLFEAFSTRDDFRAMLSGLDLPTGPAVDAAVNNPLWLQTAMAPVPDNEVVAKKIGISRSDLAKITLAVLWSIRQNKMLRDSKGKHSSGGSGRSSLPLPESDETEDEAEDMMLSSPGQTAAKRGPPPADATPEKPPKKPAASSPAAIAARSSVGRVVQELRVAQEAPKANANSNANSLADVLMQAAQQTASQEAQLSQLRRELRKAEEELASKRIEVEKLTADLVVERRKTESIRSVVSKMLLPLRELTPIDRQMLGLGIGL